MLLWTVLENKICTLDILQKRQQCGPGWCTLCKDSMETMENLFVLYCFTQSTWSDVVRMAVENMVWQGRMVEEAIHMWLSNRCTKLIMEMPSILSWGIWIAHNSVIF